MGIRETLNENPGITTGITVGIIVIAIGIIVWQSVGGNHAPLNPANAFFSDDNGKTFFVASSANLPPFNHNGKTAVKAEVFTCDNNKTQFVGYLERYTPATRDKLVAAEKADKPDMGMMEHATQFDIEVKKPGGTQWFNQNSAEGQQVMSSVACPDGSKHNLTIAWP